MIDLAHMTRWPTHGDRLDNCFLAHAKVGDGFHLAEVAAASVYGPLLSSASRFERDQCATRGCTVARQGEYAQIMIAVFRRVIQAQGLWAALTVGNKQLQATIAIEIGDAFTGVGHKVVITVNDGEVEFADVDIAVAIAI